MILRQRLLLLLIAASLVAAGACDAAADQEEPDRVRIFSKLPLEIRIHHPGRLGHERSHLACVSPGVDVPLGRCWTLVVPFTVCTEAAVAEARRLGATSVWLHRWTTDADLKRWAGATRLIRIDISGCSAITDITPLSDLPALRSVRLPHDLPWATVSAFLADAQNVTELRLGRPALEGFLREGPKSTRSLMTVPRDLKNEQLRALVRRLPQLEQLDLWLCEGLTDFSSLEGLSRLRSINLPPQAGGRVVRHLRPAKKHLRRLFVNHGWKDADLSILAEFPELEALSVSYRTPRRLGVLPTFTKVRDAALGAQAVDLLEKLPNLQTLQLGAPPNQDIAPIAQCKTLESLELHAGPGVDLRHLVPLGRLKYLVIVGPVEAKQLQPLGQLRSLESLTICVCEDLESLDFLADLRLRSLRLGSCGKVRDISALAKMSSLRELELDNYELGSHPEIGPRGWDSLKQLESLSIGGYEGLASLDWITPLTGLKRLDLSLFSDIRTTEPLKALRDLRVLRLDGLGGLESIAGLAELNALHGVELKSCSDMRDLGDLPKNPALRVLVLSRTGISKEMAGELAADREDLSIYLDRKRLR